MQYEIHCAYEQIDELRAENQSILGDLQILKSELNVLFRRFAREAPRTPERDPRGRAQSVA